MDGRGSKKFERDEKRLFWPPDVGPEAEAEEGENEDSGASQDAGSRKCRLSMMKANEIECIYVRLLGILSGFYKSCMYAFLEFRMCCRNTRSSRISDC